MRRAWVHRIIVHFQIQTLAALTLPIAFCLHFINKTQDDYYTIADALYLPRLIEDVFQRPMEIGSWVFQPVPDFIPSIPIYLLAYLITFKFQNAIVAAAAIQTCLFFGIGVLLYRCYRHNGRPLIWVACVLTLLIGMIAFDSTSSFWWLSWLFVLHGHFGSLIGALLCLYLTERALRANLPLAAAGIFVCSILFGISDYFFLLIFSAPMMIILMWLWLVSDVRGRCLVLGSAIGIGGAAAYSIGLLFNKATALYLKPFDPNRMSFAWRSLEAMFWSDGPDQMRLFGGDVERLSLLVLSCNLAAAVSAAVIVVQTWRRGRPLKEISFLNIFIIYAVGASLAVSIAVVIFGIFDGVWTLRYLNCVVFMPVLIIASLLASRVDDGIAVLKVTHREAALNVAAGLAVVASVFVMANTRIAFKAPNAPLLACLNREPVTAGMADYWNASPIILFSRWKYQVIQITSDGSPFYWITNRAWLNHDWSDPARSPRYSFIVMKNLNPDQILAAYGQPDRRVACDSTEIWFYTHTEELTRRLLERRPVGPPFNQH